MSLPPFTSSLIRNHRFTLEAAVGKDKADLLSDEEIYEVINSIVPLAIGEEEDEAVLEELEELVQRELK